MSGRQLFLVDSFRDTGRPLLDIMADPKSIFIRALAQFKRRTVYANIVNDRAAVYYTTAISRVDPFTDLNTIKINYIEGYEDVIVDPEHPVSVIEPGTSSLVQKSLTRSTQDLVKRLPTFALLTLLVPVGIFAFLVNSGIQSVRSNRRIRLHEQGKAGIVLGNYRIPLMVEDVQSAVEGVFDSLHPRRSQAGGGETERKHPSALEDATDDDDDDSKDESGNASSSSSSTSSDMVNALNGSSTEKLSKAPSSAQPDFPTLALTPIQFDMITNLDQVGFRKYPVHIHHHRHSHAAIIVRTPKKGFYEGEIVLKHWLENEFDV